ncbi:MAG: Mur ligase family protein [Dehalococcoidia bacterium]|nr:Mur ligase family protein [Dehalococcoidia bacterium]
MGVDESTLERRLIAVTRPSRQGATPTLERMWALVAALGEPQRGLPVIHVFGTAGKGSTATMIAGILRRSGLRVGLHVKPHLRSVRERIVIDGAPITLDAFSALLDEAEEAARRITPSWHELTVALALLAFRRAGVEAAVVEIGLGGPWDSTCVVEPRVSVLTNIGLDHTEILGDTVEQIAQEEAQVIRPGIPVISGATQPSVDAIVTARAQAIGAPVWRLGREIVLDDVVSDQTGVSFGARMNGWTARELRTPMLGAHQASNAALAVAAARVFHPTLTVADTRAALAETTAPGRLEIVGARPTVALDGAHSPPKMAALAAAVESLFGGRRLVAVAASMAGHDVRATWATIAPQFAAAVATQVSIAADYGPMRSVAPDAVMAALRAGGMTGIGVIEPDPVAAVTKARALAGPDGVVLVTGSLYLVGAVRPMNGSEEARR